MDRAGLVEALRAELSRDGFAMIPGATDQWGSRIYHRAHGDAVVTARLEFSGHFHQATTVSLWVGHTLWPLRVAAPRVGEFLDEAEQSACGVRDPRDHGDAWWSGYSLGVAEGIAAAVRLAVPRLVVAPPARDHDVEREVLEGLRVVAAEASALDPTADLAAVSAPESWVAVADAANMEHYRGRIGVQARAKWARQAAREAWQHRQAGLV